MAHERSALKELITTLRQQRDELRVRMHLAKADVRDEWNEVQRRLDKLADDFEPLKSAVGDSADDVVTGLKNVGEEIKQTFDRIRRSL